MRSVALPGFSVALPVISVTAPVFPVALPVISGADCAKTLSAYPVFECLVLFLPIEKERENRLTMYRPLTDVEIRQLEHQGCRADEWAAVRVADAFRPETVAMVRFCGDVRLGEFGRPVELAPGVRVPSGVTRAVLSDCTVGDGCLVRDVGCYLHGYRLDDGAMVMNCGTLSADADAEFGMDGAMAEASDEVPRRVAACDGLQAPMAALMLTGSPAAVAMRRLAARKAVAWASEERNVIGRGAVVANTVRLVNTYVGDSCEVNGASALTECALLSTDEAPVWVGAGVIAEDTVVGAGSTLDGATRLYNCYVGDYIRMRGVQASRRCFFAETPPDHGTPEAPAQRLDADGWTPERPAFRRMTPMAYDAAVSGGEADDEACGGYLRSLLDAYTLTPAGMRGDLLPRSADGPGEWVAPGGRLMPRSLWDAWNEDLATGYYATFVEAASALDDLRAMQADCLWAWAYDRLLRRYGLDTLTPDDVAAILRG